MFTILLERSGSEHSPDIWMTMSQCFCPCYYLRCCAALLKTFSIIFFSCVRHPAWHAGGCITHDKAANAKAYGTHMTPEDILSNRVDPPAHMKEFYKELTGLGHLC